MRSTQIPNQGEVESKIRLLRNLLIIGIIASTIGLIVVVVGGFGPAYSLPIGSLLIIIITCLVLLTQGILLPAQILLPTSLFVVTTYIIVVPPGFGVHDINLMLYAIVILLAGLIFGQTASFIFSILVILSIMIIGTAEIQGALVSPTSSLTSPTSLITISIVVLAIAFIQRALINLLNKNTQRVRSSEKEVIERNEELQAFSAGLEKLIQTRTAELELANQYNEHRAKQFEAIGQVSSAINQTQGLQDLLPEITQVISQQFNFYHVGIFLLDAANEYAVLVASNSEGGRKMLARNHKLKVGEVGIVGNVAKVGVPRIALDTGADAIYFNNPDLPETRSEIALPLFRSGKELIGVIDVQSTEQNAFEQEDIRILVTLAEQVSIAIANARLYEETQKALLESEMFYRRDIQTGWTKFVRSQKLAGIRRQGLKSDLLFKPIILPGIAEVNRSGDVYQKKADNNDKSTQTTIPMKLRGEIVGTLNIKTDDAHTWSRDEMDIITAIIGRAALSIENARLLTESRNAAEKERTIGEISAKISAGTEVETILKTVIRELGNQISGAQVSVEIGSDNE